MDGFEPAQSFVEILRDYQAISVSTVYLTDSKISSHSWTFSNAFSFHNQNPDKPTATQKESLRLWNISPVYKYICRSAGWFLNLKASGKAVMCSCALCTALNGPQGTYTQQRRVRQSGRSMYTVQTVTSQPSNRLLLPSTRQILSGCTMRICGCILCNFVFVGSKYPALLPVDHVSGQIWIKLNWKQLHVSLLTPVCTVCSINHTACQRFPSPICECRGFAFKALSWICVQHTRLGPDLDNTGRHKGESLCSKPD